MKKRTLCIFLILQLKLLFGLALANASDANYPQSKYKLASILSSNPPQLKAGYSAPLAGLNEDCIHLPWRKLDSSKVSNITPLKPQQTMRAITLSQFGGTENLQLTAIPMPTVKADEILVKVKAISISPVDAITRQGKGLAPFFEADQPIILGWGISGVVTEVGAHVLNFKAGDAVFSMVNFPGQGKGYAEFVAVPELQAAHKPASISHAESVSISMSGLTAWQAFTLFGKLKKGDRVLIQGAGGGVGHYAVQIAKHLGAYVIAIDAARKRDFVLSLGADAYIDYQSQRFDEIIQDIDFALISIQGDSFDRSLKVLKAGATVVSLVGGISPQSMVKAKEKGLKGSFHMGVKTSVKDLDILADLLDKGVVKSYISHRYQFSQMAEAHTQIATGQTTGKIVVAIE